MTPRDDGIFAAEYALGLLEGADRTEAETRVANDAGFAARVDWWSDRLAPMLGDAATPDAAVWDRIAARLPANDGADRSALGRWRALAVAAGAVAAGLALFIAVQVDRIVPTPAPPARTAPPPTMVAALKGDDLPIAVAIDVEQAGAQLLITPVTLATDTRVPELWVIPEDGTPRSLGVIEAAAPSRVAVPSALRQHLHGGVTLAISLEPPGGSPGAGPTGPVVATGKIVRV